MTSEQCVAYIEDQIAAAGGHEAGEILQIVALVTTKFALKNGGVANGIRTRDPRYHKPML